MTYSSQAAEKAGVPLCSITANMRHPNDEILLGHVKKTVAQRRAAVWVDPKERCVLENKPAEDGRLPVV